MARDCEHVIQLVNHILHAGDGEDNHPKFHNTLESDVIEGISSHHALGTGRKFSLLPPSQDESEISNNSKTLTSNSKFLHNSIQQI